jgi:hypothetical protein
VKANCFTCGKENDLPFTCPYCEQSFCIRHRLPESHSCPQAPMRKPLGNYEDRGMVKARVANTELKRELRNLEENQKFWRRLLNALTHRAS